MSLLSCKRRNQPHKLGADCDAALNTNVTFLSSDTNVCFKGDRWYIGTYAYREGDDPQGTP